MSRLRVQVSLPNVVQGEQAPWETFGAVLGVQAIPGAASPCALLA